MRLFVRAGVRIVNSAFDNCVVVEMDKLEVERRGVTE